MDEKNPSSFLGLSSKCHDTSGNPRLSDWILIKAFFSFFKKCHSGDIKCYSGAPITTFIHILDVYYDFRP